jgi:hypothetical protein
VNGTVPLVALCEGHGFRDHGPWDVEWFADREAAEANVHALSFHQSRAQLMAVGHALVHLHTSPDVFSFLASRLDMSAWGLPLGWSWKTLGALAWTCFPVPQNTAEGARLLWCLVGGGASVSIPKTTPTWWAKYADSDAKDACEHALQCARQETDWSFFLWPLHEAVPDDAPLPAVQGPSLGLPVYLYARGLARTGGAYKPHVLATGAIKGRDGLDRVGGVKDKAALASNRFRAFMYPAACADEPVPGDIHCLRPKTRMSARESFELFAGLDGSIDLELLQQALRDARLFVSLPKRPLAYLQYAKEGGYLGDLVAWLMHNGNERDLDDFLYIVKGLLETSGARNEDKCHEIMLSALVRHDVSELGKRQPVLAFELSLLLAQYYSRSGQPEEVSLWLALCEQWYGQVVTDDRAIALLQLYCTCHFNSWTDRYDFTSAPQGNIQEAVCYITETDWKGKKRLSPLATSKFAGKIFNTLAARSGYGGPQNLSTTIAYTKKALEAFGTDGQQRKRVYANQVFAYLDAEQWRKARSSLALLLGEAPETASPEGRSFFDLRAWVRYCGDSGEVSPQVIAFCEDQANIPLAERIKLGHPQHLLLYNVGRLLKTPKLRKAAWVRAVAAATAMNRMAFLPFALLPLTALWREGLVTEGWARSRAKGILEACRTNAPGGLDSMAKCFQVPDEFESLRFVKENDQFIFPFDLR